MKVQRELVAATPTAQVTTPKECNGVQIIWSVVSASTGLLVDPTGISLNLFVVGPEGNEIPFDVNPIAASEGHLKPTTMGPSVQLKAQAVGLTTQKVIASFHYLY